MKRSGKYLNLRKQMEKLHYKDLQNPYSLPNLVTITYNAMDEAFVTHYKTNTKHRLETLMRRPYIRDNMKILKWIYKK
jgi:hypothetical protein